MAEVFEFAGADVSQPFFSSPFNWLDPSSLPPSAVFLDNELSDPQLEVPAAGADDLFL